MQGASKILSAVCAASVSSIFAGLAHGQQAKNVIYMIADGAGFNTIRSTGLYNGNFGGEVFRQPGWVGQAMSTYPLRTGTVPVAGAAGLVQDANAVYAPARNYDTNTNNATTIASPAGPLTPLEFNGYTYTNSTAPDSANTISASMTGLKTYNNAVNVNGNGAALPTFAQLASQARGMRTGIVTTVQFSDATPAAQSGISNVARANRGEVARSMLTAPYIDVIMGAGNPDFDNNGVQRATPIYASQTGATGPGWVSQADWTDLKNGAVTPGAAGTLSSNYQLIQDRADFETLASTGTVANNNGRKIVGIVKSYDGKQQYRGPTGLIGPNYTEKPGDVPFRTDVPELSTMVSGALKILTQPNKTQGFFLGVEQGEVDRAMHSNNFGRMIEAKQEFDASLAAIDALLKANAGNANLPSYDNTLLVVTADHDHLLLGPDSDTVPFQDVTDRGVGNLPGALFQSGNHSNQLVPVFAKGPGSELLNTYADQIDSYTDASGRTFGRGSYLDQGELFNVFTTATAVPEPTSLAVLAAGGVSLLRRRRAR